MALTKHEVAELIKADGGCSGGPPIKTTDTILETIKATVASGGGCSDNFRKKVDGT